MIFLRLAGGLDNQLFQVMAALVCATRTGRDVVPLTAGLKGYAMARQPDVLRLLFASRLALTESQQRRSFFGQQFKQTKLNLTQAQQDLLAGGYGENTLIAGLFLLGMWVLMRPV